MHREHDEPNGHTLQRSFLACCVLLIATPSGPAFARVVDGRVFVDLNDDGLFSIGEVAVPDVVVFWETTQFAQTDADGYFVLELPDSEGILWARTPEGYLPGPNWAHLSLPGDLQVDLPLRVDASTAPFGFLVASDTHVGISSFVGDDVDTALMQTAGVYPTPHFLIVTGDISQSNHPDQFERVLAQAALLPFPYVPVPGNHDWYDGGVAYRRYFGPPTYSFDSGGLHFVILNDAAPLQERADFLARDLSTVPSTRPVVALMHAPPDENALALLSDVGVDHLFTGHQHANRVLMHETMIEYNTQPLGMGGIDNTPAGFRVISVLDDGDLDIRHRTSVDTPVVVLTRPGLTDVMPLCDGELLAAVESGGAVVEVTARVDGIEVPMSPMGGWVFRAELPEPCRGGTREVIINAVEATGGASSYTQNVDVRRCIIGNMAFAEWAQFQGGSTHEGVASQEIAPPLRSLWTAEVGGHLQGGSPVVSGGRVFVSIVDYSDASNGGVVAFDANTGEEEWRYRTGYSVRNAPAVAGNRVVVASNEGTVLGIDTKTGELRWSYILADDGVDAVRRNVYSAPTIVDGIAYVGIKRELVALDVADGSVVWSTAPFDTGGETSTYASPAVADGVVVQSFSRGTDGLVAFDQTDGTELWRTEANISFHLNASPIITDDGQVLAINESVEVTSVDLHTGGVNWNLPLSDAGFPWSFGVMASGALADGILFVGTQFGAIHAVDTRGGFELWRIDLASPGIVRTSHYKGEVSAISASLVVAGTILWVGTTSGLLIGLDPTSGTLIWQTNMGVPILSGLAPAGEVLFVASYDGTIRAYVTEDAACSPIYSAGCGCSGQPHPSASVWGLLLAYWFVVSRWRIRRRRLVRA